MASDMNGYHGLRDLFAQLGLPNDKHNITQFIQQHRPLPHEITLAEAPWWTASQASFLQESILDDADWATAVDELDALLRKQDE